MVKANDLGLPTTNLQSVPYAKENKKSQEDAALSQAIMILAKPEKPRRLTPNLTPSLFGE